MLVKPAQAGSDCTLECVGLDLAGQGLVTEYQDDRNCDRRQNGCQQRCPAEPPCAAVQDRAQRSDRHQQRADRCDPGGSGEQSQRSNDAGDRHRQQTTGGNPAFHRAPGRQDAQGNDGFGAQTIVQRQPEGQEHPRGGPRGRSAGFDRVTESGDDLPADQPPAGQRHDQRRQPHPDTRGRDVRPQGQQVVIPAEGRLRGAEPAVVVGHIAGVLRHPRHGEDVAVVGGIGADEVPPHQNGDDDAVQPANRPPPPRQEPPVPSSVGGVQHMKGDQRDKGERHAEHHRRHLPHRRSTAIAGVDRG